MCIRDRLGISGACVASAVSQALVFVVRAIDSRKYIHIEVGWPTLIATLAALAMQSAVAVLQPSCWQLMSGACLVAIIVMQGLGLMRFVRQDVYKRQEEHCLSRSRLAMMSGLAGE